MSVRVAASTLADASFCCLAANSLSVTLTPPGGKPPPAASGAIGPGGFAAPGPERPATLELNTILMFGFAFGFFLLFF
jgi:hypothetical protein